MIIQLGTVLFSTKIVERMATDATFAAFIGTALGAHCRGDSGQLIQEPWQTALAIQEGMNRSGFRTQTGDDIRIFTEKDKNQRSRTTVIFVDEGGCL